MADKPKSFVEVHVAADEAIKWSTAIGVDPERLESDVRYATIISNYITRGLAYMAREVEMIGDLMPDRRTDDGDR